MVSFVYFDLGGVVILDMNVGDKWTELRRELGVTPERDAEFIEFFRKYESKSLLGEGQIDDFLPLIKERFHSNLPVGYSLLMDGFIKRFEANKQIWPVIDKISKNYKIGLLTDAYTHMLDEVKKKGIMPDVKWDAVVDSSMVKAKKPETKVFKIAENKAGVSGTEIFFIDNKLQNIDGARNFGWKTLLYDPNNIKESNNELLMKLFL